MLRWDNERKEFPPMQPWMIAVLAFLCGFGFAYLVFVP